MEQESEYLTALQSAASYRIEGQDLSLLYANNTTAVTYKNAAAL